jgi:hypothetical protein
MGTTELKKKFDIILSREQRMARAIALKAIRPKPLSVWEVMIPVIFIMGYMRAKADREVFSQNMLFTKKMALEAAFDMIRKETPKTHALMQIDQKTKDLLSSVPDGIYSEQIRREQLEEAALLVDHYSKLLQAEGQDYSALVIGVFPQRQDYINFQQALSALEKKVSQAASRTLGAQTDAAMLSRIESVTQELRSAEIQKIFDSN